MTIENLQSLFAIGANITARAVNSTVRAANFTAQTVFDNFG